MIYYPDNLLNSTTFLSAAVHGLRVSLICFFVSQDEGRCCLDVLTKSIPKFYIYHAFFSQRRKLIFLEDE